MSTRNNYTCSIHNFFCAWVGLVGLLGFQRVSGAFPLPFNCEGNHQQPHPGPETCSADGRTAGALILLAELERRELDSDVARPNQNGIQLEGKNHGNFIYMDGNIWVVYGFYLDYFSGLLNTNWDAHPSGAGCLEFCWGMLIFCSYDLSLRRLRTRISYHSGHFREQRDGGRWTLGIEFAVVVIELDDGKIYRKDLYLMVKTMVSCRFSLKPVHWYCILLYSTWLMAKQKGDLTVSSYQCFFSPGTASVAHTSNVNSKTKQAMQMCCRRGLIAWVIFVILTEETMEFYTQDIST